MINFTKKLPKDVDLSPDLKMRSEGYISIKLYGEDYYIPVTKEFKKVFKAKRIKNRLEFTSYKFENALEDFLRDLISSIYLQIRDTIGSEIHQQLNQELSHGFAKLFNKFLGQKIENGFKDKLPLEHKKEINNVKRIF